MYRTSDVSVSSNIQQSYLAFEPLEERLVREQDATAYRQEASEPGLACVVSYLACTVAGQICFLES